MKYPARSAAAVIAASVLGGAGVAAVANGMTRPDSTSTTTNGASAGAGETVAAGALNDLLGGTQQLNQKLATARKDLAREMQALQHQRSAARTAARVAAAAAVAGSSQSAASVGTVSTTPPTHTYTGASGTGAPPTHTRTGASGSGSPPTHTRTGASGGGAGGGGEEGGRDD